MARSHTTFDDEAFSSDNSSYDPEEGSMSQGEDEGEEGSMSGSEDEERSERASTDGEDSVIEPDPSRSQLAVSEKINYFQRLSKKDPEVASSDDQFFFENNSDDDSSRFQEGFHDETSFGESQLNSEGSSKDDGSEDGSDSGSGSGSGSDSGSEDGSGSDEDDSMASEDLSSGSDGSGSESKAGLLDDGDEQPRAYSSGMNSRRLLLIGTAICCCVVLLALIIGIPVGLSKRNKDDDENADAPNVAPGPTMLPTAPPPTGPPVRMPVSLPNNPNIRDPETIDVEVLVRASADTTIYREGDSSDNSGSGSEAFMVVQGGVPGNSELPSAYALVEFSVDPESYQYILAPTFNATFCLTHVDFDLPFTETETTYVACVIGMGVVGDGSVDELTGETASYIMPNDCVFIEFVTLDVSPPTKKYCMDLTRGVKPILLGNNPQQRALRGSSSNHHRSLQDGSENRTVLVMIDNLSQSDQPGDRFFTSNYEGDPLIRPTLTISGEEIVECETIADLACKDARLSELCGMIKVTGLDSFLGDNRQTLTTFAPTNDAIAAAVEAGAVDMDDNDFLWHLLMYHVVLFNEIKSKDLNCEYPIVLPLVMATGNSTNIRCKDKETFVVGEGNSGANWPKITDPDIETCNGVIHIIDKMIFPSALSDITGEDILLDQED